MKYALSGALAVFAAFTVAAASASPAPAARETVVFVEAHPDDLAGHLGTAMKLAEKFEVHVIDFTHGELGCGEEKFKSGWTRRTRTAEETEVCRRAGFKLHWCEEVDGYAYAGKAACDRLAQLFKEIKPRAVFCHWPIDVHDDHVMSAAATLKAINLAGIKPERYFHEQDIQSRGFAPAYHVDITPYVEKKAQLARLYVCQGGDKIVERKAESNRVYGRNSSQRNVEVIGVFHGTVKPGGSVFDGLDGVVQ
ncbi:MAG: PIG-L family deacetylase [Kiritimatiellae bacterium]|nr:PIG-L family deacetylase [Kiritimatiellia bacterium]